jgi:cell fate regulator YaaT (PSP1 superfamily)
MPIVVGIALRRTREKYFADAGQLDLRVEERVIVDTDNGLELGVIVEPEKMVEKPKGEIYKIVRKELPDDCQRARDNILRSRQVIGKIKQSVKDHELEMKLTSVDYSFDRSKLFIYYTAETRVDFRELIKDLGHLLKTRIQMVQIGVRDETRFVGGLGPCGRELCCRAFLREFSPVSIDMAKEQDIALNTSKISGVCGRLMCCLSYEHKHYCEVKARLPQARSTVQTPEGKGVVVSINCMKEELLVDLGDGKSIRVPAASVTVISGPVPGHALKKDKTDKGKK